MTYITVKEYVKIRMLNVFDHLDLLMKLPRFSHEFEDPSLKGKYFDINIPIIYSI